MLLQYKVEETCLCLKLLALFELTLSLQVVHRQVLYNVFLIHWLFFTNILDYGDNVCTSYSCERSHMYIHVDTASDDSL